MFNEIGKKIALLIVLMIVLYFIKQWLFPSKIEPPLKQITTQTKEAKKINKDIKNENSIPMPVPIGEPPLIRLQPIPEQANQVNSGEREHKQRAKRINQKDSYESEQANIWIQTILEESEEANKSSTYTLDCWKKDINGNKYNSCEM